MKGKAATAAAAAAKGGAKAKAPKGKGQKRDVQVLASASPKKQHKAASVRQGVRVLPSRAVKDFDPKAGKKAESDEDWKPPEAEEETVLANGSTPAESLVEVEPVPAENEVSASK